MGIMMNEKMLDDSFIKIGDYKYRKCINYQSEEEFILKHNVPEERSFKFLELTLLEDYGEVMNVDVVLKRATFKKSQRGFLVMETIHLGVLKRPTNIPYQVEELIIMLNQFEDL
jgi:hypothetical protein